MKDLSEWTERQQKDLKPEQQLTSECSAEDSLHEHEGEKSPLKLWLFNLL